MPPTGKRVRKASEKSQKTLLHIVSDATGELALHMVQTMLTQFPAGTWQVRLHNFVKTQKDWEIELPTLLENGSVVVHSLSHEDKKRMLSEFCDKHSMPHFDLTGPLMDFLESQASVSPEPSLEKVHNMDEYYYRRIRAMEFTLSHDDGVMLEELPKADIILTGVSRTSKTPISMFLANKGFKMGNVPLAIETGIPQALEDYQGKNVVGLTISSLRLRTIRETREKVDGIPPGTYSSREHVNRELRMAADLYKRKGWPVLDVSYASIEESAWKVLRLLELPPPI